MPLIFISISDIMRRLSDVLNLFTPKKPKKKFCAEEEEDLNLATPRVFGVRKVNGKSDKEQVGKSDGAKCTSPPRVQVEKILSQDPL